MKILFLENERGDLLIFLSGIADITTLSEAIIEYSREHQNWIVLQLHSSLSIAEQDKVHYFLQPVDISNSNIY